MESIVVYTDGGSRNNPGEAGLGAIAYQGNDCILKLSEYLGMQTNNYAEYTAVIRALEELLNGGFGDVDIEMKMDSKLVVEQVQGRWKVKEPTLKPLVARVQELATQCKKISFTHIPREKNKEADALANDAMDRRTNSSSNEY